MGSAKLPNLLELKYGTTADTRRELEAVAEIRQTFNGFQRQLYERDDERPNE